MRPRTTCFRRRLGFETLETREMLSGVTAVLNHGVLSVTGDSNSHSTIHVWRQDNRIQVKGVDGSFAANQVRSIRVTCGQNGDQTVTLGVASTNGQTALARPVTVTSGNGNETVRLGSTNVYFAGTGHRLTVSASGVARLDGAKPDWFDTHLRDAAIRSLAKTSYVDHALGRADMLAIFDEVEQHDGVTTVEFGDLKALARNSSLFVGVAYVQNLSGNVILGNKANAHYQGERLGNLTAGDSAEHLEKLVNKWFLGLDRPDSTYDKVTYAYAQAAASLFPHTPVYTDIWQGILGDCYYLAGLAEIALHNPDAIQSMFIVNGDGTYTVRLFHDRRAEYVTVDSYLPEDAQGKYVFANDGYLLTDQTVALWVPLAEKAYAQINEEGWLRSHGQNSYASLEDGYPSHAFTEVTGSRAVGGLSFTKAQSRGEFTYAYQASSLLSFLSKETPPNGKIVGDHCYAVIDYHPSSGKVLLYNPWGINNGSQYPGLLWLSWSEVAANFDSWYQSLGYNNIHVVG